MEELIANNLQILVPKKLLQNRSPATTSPDSIILISLSIFTTSSMLGLFQGSSAVHAFATASMRAICSLHRPATGKHGSNTSFCFPFPAIHRTQPTKFPPPSPSSCPIGARPVSSSNITTPKLYTSPFAVDFIVSPYSGGMYPNVPARSVLTWVSHALMMRARPKSETLGSKLSSSRMLLDFMSRWMMWGTNPWCRNASPRADPRQILNLAGHERASTASARFLSQTSRLPFSMNRSSLKTQYPSNGTKFRCFTLPIVSISAKNSRSPWNRLPPCSRLIATLRPSGRAAL
ncbi:hypothetical protein ACMD2_09101 [Ananas comosus]|uniref:Uncharacterized protein n=1 Tax=Ananas comosus TaxID=4615 RepID=A0A199VUN8_ANACO|nr:hypothetical protein ACMD2_09101 [Ananas comosus]